MVSFAASLQSGGVRWEEEEEVCVCVMEKVEEDGIYVCLGLTLLIGT